MNVKYEEIVIAAYLHDVGKFAQRADEKKLYNEELENKYCKEYKGYYSHQHVIYTAEFIDRYKFALPYGVNPANVLRLAASHHSPSTVEDWLITEADRLSSGSDRCNILDEAENNSSVSRDIENEHNLKFYEKPMIHLMSTLNLDGRDKTTPTFCKMSALEEDNILPTDNMKIGKADYSRLWDDFVNDFQRLQELEFDEYIQSLDSLLQRYWWCIPSATNSDADISLYQHAKTTAAFAGCLYRYHEQNETLKESDIRNSTDKKFMFINGDISGIQKYIFDLKSTEDSAKLLRAKSFQLWAISKILSEYMCKQFGVCSANIVTSAGGKFLIVVPNTDDSQDKLIKLRTEIESYFIKEFAGKLAVIISDGILANASDLQQGKMKDFFYKIADVSDESKQKKMQIGLAKCGAVLDEYYDELQKNGECPKCGIFPANEHGGECHNCAVLTQIGEKLVKKEKFEIKSEKLLHFGQMIRSADSTEKFAYTVNDYHPGMPLLLLPYIAPHKADETLKTFEEIADNSNGVKKLAMFKADIDNLGLVFSKSLGDRKSISRYADMSAMLHYFFSSFYAWFVQNTEYDEVPYSDTIYTVFSGGDDLCVLGSWDAVIHFAADFRKALGEFTNHNPSVTISGGIALANPNVPVSIIAEMAESNLDESKKHIVDGKIVKNAITVFGTTVGWDEYDKCLQDGQWLADLLEKKIISTSVVYKMIDFARRAEEVRKGNVKDLIDFKKNDIRNYSWKSNYSYIISRNINDNDVKKRMFDFAVKDEDMINSRIAVSYALYKNRNN